MNPNTLNRYNTIKNSINGFVERKGQKEMIGIIDDALSKNSGIHLLNAGTGSGKTLAYLIGTYPASDSKKVVICTGTVALQEQIVKKDVPSFINAIKSKAKVMVAKGRGRYICRKQLSERVEYFKANPAISKDVKSMIADFENGSWAGDLDHYGADVNHTIKRSCSVDGVTCMQNTCPYSKNCSFASDRAKLDKANIVVTNYNLLLTDLEKEGSRKVLPEIDKAVWIFDEADKLPEIIRYHYEGRFEPKRIGFYLKNAHKSIQMSNLPPSAKNGLLLQCRDLINTYETITAYFDSLFASIDKTKGHRYKKGVIDTKLIAVIKRIRANAERIAAWSNAVREVERDSIENNPNTRFSTRAIYELEIEAGKSLILCDGFESDYNVEPNAKFVTCKNNSWALNSISLDYPKHFYEQFWKAACDTHCFLTSATLKIAGSFSHFIGNSGLNYTKHQCHDIASPFHYPSVMTYQKVEGLASPKEKTSFVKCLISELPNLINGHKASLVLFTSKSVMNDVYQALEQPLKDTVLVQGSCGFKELIEKHKNRCDTGVQSTIFGLKMCAIGLDLPKQYCDNVIITKIDFPIPTGFFDEAFGEYIVHHGGSPFYEHAIPEALKVMVQSIGRLIRTEEDAGVVKFCDNRLWKTKYGKSMARHLPKGAWV